MKTKSFFKLVNGAMALICMGTMYMNYVSTNVINSSCAISKFKGNTYEYRSEGTNFCEIKNGKTVGSVDLGKNYKFTKNIFSLNQCAVGVGVAALASGIGAAATGGSFVAAAGAVGANALATITGGAITVGAAVAPVAVPGAAAVEATLGGAGMVAAEAAIAPAAMGAAALSGLAMVGGAVLAGAALT
ncbi:MAG: hypothetical protein LBP36_04150 [Oscillospiraceae bacterium]|nr:hypothetical protein [Oscillospiraceae bacterium]